VLLCIERLLCPSVTNIDLGATFPGANMVQALSKSDYLVGHFGLGRTFWSDVRVDIKRFFFTFLEMNVKHFVIDAYL
jgi:hypothetical protein